MRGHAACVRHLQEGALRPEHHVLKPLASGAERRDAFRVGSGKKQDVEAELLILGCVHTHSRDRVSTKEELEVCRCVCV